LFLFSGIPFSAFSTGDVIRHLLNLVDVAKYREANPDPLDAIPENAVFQVGEEIGSGTHGTVYLSKISRLGNRQQFIRKIVDTDNEATM
jgi:hypothetical protein